MARNTRAFLLALAASAALHVVLVAELPGVPLRFAPAEPPLHAEIVALEPSPPPALPEPHPKPRPPAPRKATPPAPADPPAAPPRPVTVAPPVEDAAVLVPQAPETPPEDFPAPDEPPLAAAAPEAALPAASQESAEAPEAPPDAVAEAQADPVARSGSIRYEVYYGSDHFSIGRSVQTWSIDKDSYRLTSVSETTGLLGFLKPYQYTYVTEGRVEPEGLKPETFVVRRGRSGERQATALFDWSSRQLTFGRLGSTQTAELTPQSYDLLTLFFQLARTPPAPGRLEVSVTTGTKFRSYVLEVGPEEMLELPIGTLRAIPVRQVRRPGEESMEVWLAPEKHYLPVRICFLDEDGNLSVEQVATQIASGTVAADGR